MSKVDPVLLRNVFELVKSGDVVWDVGANVGLFTFSSAARAGPGGAVVAFEPDTWLVQLLRRSRQLQAKTSAAVTIVPAAVASQVDLRRYQIGNRSRASNALAGYGHSQAGSIVEEQVVPTFNLDWLLTTFQAPCIIKCDVEGAEVEVFAGQDRMLRQVRPIVVCEVGRDSALELTRILVEAGYTMFDGQEPLENASKIAEAAWNTIAIPDEKVPLFAKSGAR